MPKIKDALKKPANFVRENQKLIVKLTMTTVVLGACVYQWKKIDEQLVEDLQNPELA